MRHTSFGIGTENKFGHYAERGTYKTAFLFDLIYAQLLSSVLCNYKTSHINNPPTSTTAANSTLYSWIVTAVVARLDSRTGSEI
jgi:hypothetical protein